MEEGGGRGARMGASARDSRERTGGGVRRGRGRRMRRMMRRMRRKRRRRRRITYVRTYGEHVQGEEDGRM